MGNSFVTYVQVGWDEKYTGTSHHAGDVQLGVADACELPLR